MFIKKSLKTQKNRNYVPNAIYVYQYFFRIAKIPDFLWKNVDASRIQGVYHAIYIFLGLL